MDTDTDPRADLNFRRIAQAISWIAANRQDQPDVARMAAAVELSEAHFSRLFRRWAGISPQRYLAHLTLGDARQRLGENSTVEQAAWASGLSGSARLHDLFVRIDAVSPGEFRRGGEGLALRFAFAATRFGDALLARGSRGIVALRFGSADARDARLAQLQGEWPNARFEPDPALASEIAVMLEGGSSSPGGAARQQPVDVLLRGTPFQHKVWQALLDIGAGDTLSYGELAQRIGKPGAARAVGSAVGANPVAVLIPCHRVLRGDGQPGGYRWGVDRKHALLAWERCAGLGGGRPAMLSSQAPQPVGPS